MRSVRSGAFVFLTVILAGCGLAGPAIYELDEKTVEVEVGEEFTLAVPVDVALGENWSLTAPEPDARIVRSSGNREEYGDSGDYAGGSSGTSFFDFEAVGKGTTRIRLVECPDMGCTGGGDSGRPVVPSPVPSGSPTPDAEDRAKIHTYTVTVK